LRTHRIFTAQLLEPGSRACIDGAAAHYLARVLRVTAGQPLILFNGDGNDYAAEVVSPRKGEIVVEVLNRLPSRVESGFRITLAQALSRGERMDLTLQKCTELGVAAFQPLITERVEVRIHPEKLPKRMDHWQQVVVAACEQSGRAVVPVVGEPLPLHEWLDAVGAGARVALVPGAEIPLARCDLGSPVEILIGPEGGFSEAELGLIERCGVRAVGLGPRILRTETAGPAAVVVLQTLFGDFA
jgi:16S rRNA (uracil1498-N3)-methyltransferase